MSTPAPRNSQTYSIIALIALIIVGVAGYWGYKSVQDMNHVPLSNIETEKKGLERPAPEPPPVVQAVTFTQELAPQLANRLKSWNGFIRVDVTPAKFDSSLSVDKGFRLIRIKDDGTEEVALRDEPLSNATPKIENGNLFLDTPGSKYESRTAKASSLNAHIGRADAMLEITPKEDGTIWVGEHCYRGSLRILMVDGKIRMVNVVPMEDYIASVVDSEMPATFSVRGRQAQAIVARSYALYHILTAPRELLSDVTDTTRHQRYLGYVYRGKDGRRFAGETKSGRAIAESTKGIICVHRGDVLLTYFSACCGGTNNRLPEMYRDFTTAYHKQEDPYCKEAPVSHWTESLSSDRFIDELRNVEPGKNWGDIFHGIRRTNNAPIGIFELELAQGRKQSINGERLQRVFSLKSSFFDVQMKNGSVVFEGEGHGHAVGLCQWGANLAGQQGKSAEEILEFYYDDTQLVRLPE